MVKKTVIASALSPSDGAKFLHNFNYLHSGLSLGRISAYQVFNLIRTSGLDESDTALLWDRLEEAFPESRVGDLKEGSLLG